MPPISIPTLSLSPPSTLLNHNTATTQSQYSNDSNTHTHGRFLDSWHSSPRRRRPTRRRGKNECITANCSVLFYWLVIRVNGENARTLAGRDQQSGLLSVLLCCVALGCQVPQSSRVESLLRAGLFCIVCLLQIFFFFQIYSSFPIKLSLLLFSLRFPIRSHSCNTHTRALALLFSLSSCCAVRCG
ncbi:hypothetical protein CAOG_010077 [Capsaspora owczarzaki ATCC 30864]|uniref:Uncharacterized protein n=1 Tax=Capsaspora owczarzaki (strain ATCC 30864) TaxID=595528 RepID=A0A0D2WW20_CAPO3|nr:hypothetical protein CAOG_010077 [Capsaspora owczarzaki ATCC 30864]